MPQPACSNAACISAACAAVHLPNAAAPGAAAAYVGLQAVAAICAGATYTALFALRGSLAEVALLHAANNAVAVAWLAGAGTGSCALAAAPPAGERAALGMALLGAQVAAYAAAAVAAVARLRALLARDELAAGGRGAFKRLHGVVYGGEGEEEEEAGKLE